MASCWEKTLLVKRTLELNHGVTQAMVLRGGHKHSMWRVLSPPSPAFSRHAGLDDVGDKRRRHFMDLETSIYRLEWGRERLEGR